MNTVLSFERRHVVVTIVADRKRLWPNASMLTYQRAQPLVKALCAKHGVPYVQPRPRPSPRTPHP